MWNAHENKNNESASQSGAADYENGMAGGQTFPSEMIRSTQFSPQSREGLPSVMCPTILDSALGKPLPILQVILLVTESR